MKKFYFNVFCIACLLLSVNLSAQQWSGSNNTTGTISRTGDVSFGSNLGLSKVGILNGSNSEWSFTAMNKAGGGKAALFKGGWTNGTTPILQVETSIGGIPMSSAGILRFLVRADGKVGIGTNNFLGNHLLYVAGGVIAEEVTVKLEANWPDFVFDSKYDLMSLSEVEDFIKENNHLPNVPSEKQVKKDGIDLGKMDATLLRKIEELTLYVIELKKEIETLKDDKQ